PELQAVGFGDERRAEPQRVPHQPGGRLCLLGYGVVEVGAQDPAAGSPEGATAQLGALGLPEIAAVQRSGEPAAGGRLEPQGGVDGGVDRDGATGGGAACAEDAREQPRAGEWWAL